MRWHIFDSGLVDGIGHHINRAALLIGELRQRGIDVACYAHQGCTGRCGPVELQPLFRDSLYDVSGSAERVARLNAHFAADLSAVTVGADDVALFPCIAFNQMQGIVEWANSHEPGRCPTIAMVLRFPPDGPYPGQVSTDDAARHYRAAWARLAPEQAGRVLLCVETMDLADQYEALLGTRPRVLPSWGFGRPLRGRPLDTGEPVIAYVGHARHERGFHLLPDIIDLCRRGGVQASFLIQSQHRNEPDMARVEERLSGDPSVSLLRGRLTMQEYGSAIAMSSLVLLPYESARYGARTSAVHGDAARMGIPAVVPAGTWMARAAAVNANGIAFPSFTAAGVAGAVVRAMGRLRELRNSSILAAQRLSRFDGTAAYVDALLRPTPPTAPPASIITRRSTADQGANLPLYDVSVVMTTTLRPSLRQALDSVYRQTGGLRIQVLIGVDVVRGDPDLLTQALEGCPRNVTVAVVDPGYSTSARHGGLYPAFDGGALRTVLSYLAHSRFVTYLDDDNWLAPEHLSALLAATAGNDWAFTRRTFVAPGTDEVVGEDNWDSAGPHHGKFDGTTGGFVDPNCLMIDKVACEPALRLWCVPLMRGREDPATMTADRRIFDFLYDRARVGDTRRPTVYYRMADGKQAEERLKDMAMVQERKGIAAARQGDPAEE